jgi:hypothetical protein
LLISFNSVENIFAQKLIESNFDIQINDAKLYDNDNNKRLLVNVTLYNKSKDTLHYKGAKYLESHFMVNNYNFAIEDPYPTSKNDLILLPNGSESFLLKLYYPMEKTKFNFKIGMFLIDSKSCKTIFKSDRKEISEVSCERVIIWSKKFKFRI